MNITHTDRMQDIPEDWDDPENQNYTSVKMSDIKVDDESMGTYNHTDKRFRCNNCMPVNTIVAIGKYVEENFTNQAYIDDEKIRTIEQIVSKPGATVTKGKRYDEDVKYLLDKIQSLANSATLNEEEHNELVSARRIVAAANIFARAVGRFEPARA